MEILGFLEFRDLARWLTDVGHPAVLTLLPGGGLLHGLSWATEVMPTGRRRFKVSASVAQLDLDWLNAQPAARYYPAPPEVVALMGGVPRSVAAPMGPGS